MNNLRFFLENTPIMDYIAMTFWIILSVVIVCLIIYGHIYGNYIKKKRLMNGNRKKQNYRIANEQRVIQQINDCKGDTILWNFILQLSTEKLLENLKAGKIRPVDVLQAFQNKAIYVNRKLNCVVNFLPEALQMAIDLENLPEKKRGPLYGIPFSVKECFFIKGHDSTTGLSFNNFNTSQHNSLVIEKMIQLGAIPFCQTNVPQTIYSVQTSNPIYGETVNPYNTNRSCGGSSGGEGALVGAGGSILGIGNDIGGSLRNPAAVCGCVAMKPTFGRHLSSLDIRKATSHEAVDIVSVGGFITRDLDTLALVWKIIYQHPFIDDPLIAPIPWREEIFTQSKPLRIGYIDYDEFYHYHPANVRGVILATEILAKNGHSIQKIKSPPVREIYSTVFTLLADCTSGVGKSLSKDFTTDSSMAHFNDFKIMIMFPVFIQKLFGKLIKMVTKLPSVAYSGKSQAPLCEKRRYFMNEYLKYLNEIQCDAFITPGSLFPAPIKKIAGKVNNFLALPYLQWSFLDMPAGIVPITKVNKKDEEALKNWPNDDLMYKMMRPHGVGTLGLPISVQIIGRRYNEELILKIMKELEFSRFESFNPTF